MTAQLGLGLPGTKSARRMVSKPNPTLAARSVADALVQGGRVLGMTKGQFSLLDLLRALLEKTGPADVAVSTWTMGIRDAKNAGLMLDSEAMTSFRLYVDRSFATRQPGYCSAVRKIFGDESIRTTNTHAKIATIRNERWAITVRSSMNLNRNPRFENFDIDDDVTILEFFEEHFSEMSTAMPAGPKHPSALVNAVFSRLARGLLPFDMPAWDDLEKTGAPLHGGAPAFEKWVRAALAKKRKTRRKPNSIGALAGMVGMSRTELRAGLKLDPVSWEQAALDVVKALA